jgi:hypothetical protein
LVTLTRAPALFFSHSVIVVAGAPVVVSKSAVPSIRKSPVLNLADVIVMLSKLPGTAETVVGSLQSSAAVAALTA